MPYTETHEIAIGPITLPDGVTLEVQVATGTGGQQAVTVVGSTTTSKLDTVNLLRAVFATLMVAASAEGVGQPVFVAPTPAPTA